MTSQAAEGTSVCQGAWGCIGLKCRTSCMTSQKNVSARSHMTSCQSHVVSYREYYTLEVISMEKFCITSCISSLQSNTLSPPFLMYCGKKCESRPILPSQTLTEGCFKKCTSTTFKMNFRFEETLTFMSRPERPF